MESNKGSNIFSTVLSAEEWSQVPPGIAKKLEAFAEELITSMALDETKKAETECSGTMDHVMVQCGVCPDMIEPVYRGNWLCERHAPKQRTCEYSTKGCTYSDFDAKCEIHELPFCPYNTECFKCGADITGTTVEAHYTQAHGDMSHRAGTVCTIDSTLLDEDYFWILGYDFGRVMIAFMPYELNFRLWVYTPIPSAQLFRYRCTVELSHPVTGHTLSYLLAVRYNSQFDWYMNIPLTDYNTCVHGSRININLNITKMHDPNQFNV